MKVLHDFTDEIISTKIAELKRNEIYMENVSDTTTDNDNFCRKPKTIIEVLLEHSHEMPHEQLRDELFTIISGILTKNI